MQEGYALMLHWSLSPGIAIEVTQNGSKIKNSTQKSIKSQTLFMRFFVVVVVVVIFFNNGYIFFFQDMCSIYVFMCVYVCMFMCASRGLYLFIYLFICPVW